MTFLVFSALVISIIKDLSLTLILEVILGKSNDSNLKKIYIITHKVRSQNFKYSKYFIV